MRVSVAKSWAAKLPAPVAARLRRTSKSAADISFWPYGVAVRSETIFKAQSLYYLDRTRRGTKLSNALGIDVRTRLGKMVKQQQ